ncbi:MAG: hypothetical protein ACYC3I_18775 [Gemmataceae bacterium]
MPARQLGEAWRFLTSAIRTWLSTPRTKENKTDIWSTAGICSKSAVFHFKSMSYFCALEVTVAVNPEVSGTLYFWGMLGVEESGGGIFLGSMSLDCTFREKLRYTERLNTAPKSAEPFGARRR